ncbi:MAG: S24 family peptidase [Chitinophagia bacterium]
MSKPVENKTKSELAKRLDAVMTFFDIDSIRSLALSIGMDVSQLNKAYRGELGLPSKWSMKISTKFGVSLDWLLTGVGQMLRTEDLDKLIIKEPDTNYLAERLQKKNTKERTLEYYEIGANAATKSTGEILPISKSVGKLHLNELFKGSQFAIRVSGNSMTPNYPSGCIIGIRLIEDFMINPGSVYVIETGNDLWIKRLYYLNNDRSTETIVLMSDNKMKEESGERQGQYCYPSFTLHKSEIKNIFRVTGVFKSNTLTIIEN